MAIPRFGAIASGNGGERWVWKVGWKGSRASEALEPGCPWTWERKVEKEDWREAEGRGPRAAASSGEISGEATAGREQKLFSLIRELTFGCVSLFLWTAYCLATGLCGLMGVLLKYDKSRLDSQLRALQRFSKGSPEDGLLHREI